MQSAMLVVMVVTEGHGRRSGESRHRGHMSAGPVAAPEFIQSYTTAETVMESL